MILERPSRAWWVLSSGLWPPTGRMESIGAITHHCATGPRIVPERPPIKWIPNELHRWALIDQMWFIFMSMQVAALIEMHQCQTEFWLSILLGVSIMRWLKVREIRSREVGSDEWAKTMRPWRVWHKAIQLINHSQGKSVCLFVPSDRRDEGQCGTAGQYDVHHWLNHRYELINVIALGTLRHALYSCCLCPMRPCFPNQDVFTNSEREREREKHTKQLFS